MCKKKGHFKEDGCTSTVLTISANVKLIVICQIFLCSENQREKKMLFFFFFFFLLLMTVGSN